MGLGHWPTLSGPNRDGGRHVGIRVLPSARGQMQAKGVAVVNQMRASSVDWSEVPTVRIGDVFTVRFDGDKSWIVWRLAMPLGKLTWSLGSFARGATGADAGPRIDDGSLQVIRLMLDERGRVVNAGGIVRKRRVPVPPLSGAVQDVDIESLLSAQPLRCARCGYAMPESWVAVTRIRAAGKVRSLVGEVYVRGEPDQVNYTCRLCGHIYEGAVPPDVGAFIR